VNILILCSGGTGNDESVIIGTGDAVNGFKGQILLPDDRSITSYLQQSQCIFTAFPAVHSHDKTVALHMHELKGIHTLQLIHFIPQLFAVDVQLLGLDIRFTGQHILLGGHQNIIAAHGIDGFFTGFDFDIVGLLVIKRQKGGCRQIPGRSSCCRNH